MSTQNFVLDKAPYIRKADNKGYGTAVMMRDFLIALLPLIIFAWVKNGLLPFINGDTSSVWNMLRPLVMVALGGLTSYLTELGFYILRGEKDVFRRLKVSFPAIPGILLAMILPFKTPLWVLILGAFFATFFGKLVFGGFGNNIFNPALVGYIFVTTAFTSQILGNYLNPSETIITGATPMATLGSDFAGGVPAILNQYPLWKIFVGLVPGALAETSALLCLLALAYLLIRKVINWRIPVIYLATVFVLTYIIGAFNGYATDLTYPLVYLFSGALMFGAVFMATEPVTSPRSPNGKIVYALFLGVLTVLFRYRSNMPEGGATSILIMNVFAVIIDRLAARLRVEPNKRKVVIQYAVIGLLALGIGAYGVSAAAPKKSVEAEIVYKTKVQDLESFDFLYTITVDDDEITVTTDQAYKIKKISNKAYDNAEYKDKFNEIIKKQKFADYIVSAEEGLDYLEVVVSAQAQYRITAVVRYDADYRMVAFNADISNETYDDEEYYKGWDPADGDPAVDTPNDILANQDNLDAVQPITGATNTCVGMINAARTANRYRDYIIGSSELALIGKSQDFSDLNFRYYFRQNGEKFVVTTDQDYEVLTDLESDVKEAVERLIAKNKFMGYIESVATEGENTVLVVKTKRPAGIDFVTSSITFTGGRITAFEADTEHEDYDVSYNNDWKEENGHPKDIIPGRIIENQDDLEGVEAITGATDTTNILIEAARIAISYMEAGDE